MTVLTQKISPQTDQFAFKNSWKTGIFLASYQDNLVIEGKHPQQTRFKAGFKLQRLERQRSREGELPSGNPNHKQGFEPVFLGSFCLIPGSLPFQHIPVQLFLAGRTNTVADLGGFRRFNIFFNGKPVTALVPGFLAV